MTAVTVQPFIDHKARQLSFYLRGYWNNQIPYRELDLFFWDTLEEWVLVQDRETVPYSPKEKVFWHVLHQMHFWEDSKLRSDPFLRGELNTCLEFLEGEGFCPLDCIGIRP